ncbi:Lrp/AsnC family transcriptional regulator, leucine-responsive regulatory protein [Filimonas lacunae]|uniref:Lrp/AsnC family transcriptional regulator, leucine-responsive regulatory protein n=1 Tax=Filimonas lacunae TaxID=477680 RepID=A0A173MJ37_9BACT|nr:Lrp/AsnC family transcriptional regulator [Filimonas lacunae]BAV07421.1 leucine-responsive regulatory protein, regulator for leucine (or lrp) regulon and high-affinity branched-chain amino acid transport system [Filimonas lacunae]SIT30438.1 Lrp/AsnC family transcriptional regulator, leucine-responsive regulatory protein [Filimonas lacunae]
MGVRLDDIDLQILRLVQDNARISNADLARELGMAPSAVLERVRKLEQKQVIKGYHTVIDPAAVDQKLLAFIHIRTKDTDIEDIVTAGDLAKIPEVQEIHHVAGEDCFIVKVRTADSASLMHLLRNVIKKLPGVLATRTTIVLETSKEQQQVVIPKQ